MLAIIPVSCIPYYSQSISNLILLCSFVIKWKRRDTGDTPHDEMEHTHSVDPMHYTAVVDKPQENPVVAKNRKPRPLPPPTSGNQQEKPMAAKNPKARPLLPPTSGNQQEKPMAANNPKARPLLPPTSGNQRKPAEMGDPKAAPHVPPRSQEQAAASLGQQPVPRSRGGGRLSAIS